MSNKTDTKKKAILVSHTHWDRAWYLTFNEFRVRLVRMIDRIIELLESNSSYNCFVLDGQVVLIEDYLEIRPDNESHIRALIQQGRLVIGPWYVLPDLFLVSGESIIRNLQIGLEMSNDFGNGLKVGYVPDPFGHPGQLPQILQGLDIDNFIFMRGMPESINQLGTLHFNWLAPDGTSVRAYYTKEGYFNTAALGHPHVIGRYDMQKPTYELAKKQVEEAQQKLSELEPKGLYLFNNGIDHMPEQPEIPELLSKLNAESEDLDILHGSFADFIDELKKIDCTYSYEGDLLGNPDHPILSSVYSARMYIKQQNHQAQSLLEKYTEPMSVLRHSLTGESVDPHFLTYCWTTLLKNHPHDDICGCSVDAVHDDNEARFRDVCETTSTLIKETLEELIKRGFTKGYESEHRFKDVFLYNPHPFEHNFRIKTSFVFANQDPSIEEQKVPYRKLRAYDAFGKAIQFTVTHSHSPVLDAQFIQHTWGRLYEVEFDITLSPMGYQIVRFIETSDELLDDPAKNVANVASAKNPLTVDRKGVVRNSFYTISFTHNHWVLKCRETGCELHNPLLFEYQRDNGDTYSFSKFETKNYYATIKNIEQDVVRPNVIHILYELLVPSGLPKNEPLFEQSHEPFTTIELNVTLELDSSKSIKTTIEYINSAENGRLRALYTIGFETSISYAESQFNEVEHVIVPEQKSKDFPNRYANYPGELHYLTHHQVDYSYVAQGDKYMWVANRGLPEYELVNHKGLTHIAVTLHRAVGYLSVSNGSIRRPQAGPSIPTPGAQCLRKMKVELAFGSLLGQKTDLIKEAKAFAHPAYSLAFPILHGAPTIGSLPRHHSLLEIHNPNVLMSAFYVHRNGYYVLRLYNSTGSEQMSQVSIGFKAQYMNSAKLDDVWDAETASPIDSQHLYIPLQPHEITTLLFTV
ncbi:MAG: glycoside hydrolase [Balneolaceae bacterium]|nr:glycoside hydrolase [Balneolaceae bacterium]MBL6916235.1 glycoside hydrolase [Balneolaceae bacterium]